MSADLIYLADIRAARKEADRRERRRQQQARYRYIKRLDHRIWWACIGFDLAKVPVEEPQP